MTSLSAIPDPKQTNLYWRPSVKYGEIAVWRQKINGRDRWKTLGPMTREDARKMIRDLAKKEGKNALAQRLGLLRNIASISKIKNLFEAYDTYSTGARIEAETARCNKRSFERILKTTKGESLNIADSPIDIFDIRTLRAYEELKIREARDAAKKAGLSIEKTEHKIESAQRTVQSTVRQARSLFAQKALQSPAYEKIVLPDDLEKTMKIVVGISTLVDYIPLAPEIISRIQKESASLKTSDPSAWLVLKLCANSGMRRSSVIHARRDWFGAERTGKDGKPCVELHVKVAKGRRSIPLFPLNVFKEIEPFFAETFLIPGATENDRDRAAVRLGHWLREMGLDKKDRRCPIHELRALFGDSLNQVAGAAEVQRQLGHADMSTGQAYRQNKGTVSVKVV